VHQEKRQTHRSARARNCRDRTLGLRLYVDRKCGFSMNTQWAEATPREALARALGPSTAGAIVVGTVIGSGIFLVPAEMLQAVGSARLVYAAWAVAGLLS